MTELMMNTEPMELDMEELVNVAGGGKFVRPAEKEGFRIYQIRSNDTLIRIANRFHLKTYREILEWNPQITNPRIIIPGDYLYIKKFH